MDLSRRAIVAGLLTAVTTVALLAGLAGCGVSPSAQGPGPGPTAPRFTGISVTSSDHSVGLRELYVPDPGTVGYPAGLNIVLTVQVWNNTNAPVSLTGAAAYGKPVVLVGAAAQPTATFTIDLPAGGFVPLSRESGRYLQIPCIPAALATGTAVDMTFSFSNGAKVEVSVPVGAFPTGSTAPPATGATTPPTCAP